MDGERGAVASLGGGEVLGLGWRWRWRWRRTWELEFGSWSSLALARKNPGLETAGTRLDLMDLQLQLYQVRR